MIFFITKDNDQQIIKSKKNQIFTKILNASHAEPGILLHALVFANRDAFEEGLTE
jgi:hypothetical protein